MMNTGRLLSCIAVFLFGMSTVNLSRADIFSFSDENGAIALSNTLTDSRYTLLLKTPVEMLPTVSALAVSSVRSLPSIAQSMPFGFLVDEAARANRVDAALLHAVITAESNYNPSAVSKKGASGLMQLMPATAKRYGVSNLYDPAQNVRGGARYLKDLLLLFNNDLRLTLAAYNAGENAVIRCGKKIPPFRETIGYVNTVLELYNQYRISYS